MNWAYALTTVPERKDKLFPQTLKSLAKGGFDQPHLFIDDCDHRLAQWYTDRFNGLIVTARTGRLRTYGHWILSLAEIYIRNPTADRYAMFQDDFVTYPNLRSYLEWCPYPVNGYWNLYTFPSNQAIASLQNIRRGWFESNQLGRGAVALVFDRRTVQLLLSHQDMVDRVTDPRRGHSKVDGAVVNALAKVGIKEYCHTPSLTQHTGRYSSMGNKPHPLAKSFLGEDFDATRLIVGGG